jgi:hypothetical protein
MDNIQIEPCQIAKNIKSFKIDVPYIVINKLAIIRVQCFDENNLLVITYDFELVDEEYQLWKDDKDLINYVCEKYNFVLENIM